MTVLEERFYETVISTLRDIADSQEEIAKNLKEISEEIKKGESDE